MKKVMLLSTLLFVISGCSNPFTKYYTDLSGGVNVLKEQPLYNFIISKDKPRLLEGSNLEQDAYNMLENGYGNLGFSNFNAGEIDQKQAIEQAKKIHADTVIVYRQYTDTLSGSMPLTLPDTQTSYHSGSIYGSGGGFATFSGTSTTYGTQTTYVPYHVRRYDYLATYWIKFKPSRLGIHFDDLTPELRDKIESNKGIYVVAVVKNSPAFNADLLRNDIIRKFNDIDVNDVAHFSKLLSEYIESNIRLEIIRNGKFIIKNILLVDLPASSDTKAGN